MENKITEDNKSGIPLPTIRRLPLYASVLFAARNKNMTHISSSYIAKELALEPIQVRKDLSGIGITGQAKIGFPVSELIEAIEKCLGWDNRTDALIVGAGHLGAALAGYRGFVEHGLHIVALFDMDPQKIGKSIQGKEVFDMNKLNYLTRRLNILIGILTVPAGAAQHCADLMIEAGIKAIWNFTPAKLMVPKDIIIERVDLAASLAVLSNKLQAVIKKTD